MNSNPLLSVSKLKDQAVPFNLIKNEHFLPALKQTIADAHKKFNAIINNPETANFENTILALELLTDDVDYVSAVYSNLEIANGDEEMHKLAKEIYPLRSQFGSDITLNEKIFFRIKEVYNKKESLKLNNEQLRLLEKTYKSFVRNGALLSPTEKDTLRKIDQELSVLSPQFSENVLKATNAFEMWIDHKEDLAGLPETAIEAAAHAAEAKGQTGKWLFNLQYPSYLPFITYSAKRNLREKIWKAASSKCFNDKFDNQEVVKKIIALKSQRAKLLGYNTHADFVLEERMAKDVPTVQKFLTQLLGPSKKAAQKDLAELQAFAKDFDGTAELMPWDISYYSEKLKEKKFSFNEEDLRPYFKLENVIQGVFEHAKKLYGLTFKENKELPVYHPEVKVYEVFEEKTGKYMSLFYADFFPRETKKGGAWATSFRDQGMYHNEIKRPHASIVCNFTKPTPTKPSLLSYDEVRTLFHEFGHALHVMLSECTYRSVGGFNVYWDFVELPSQIMENWVTEKEGLDLFARHYETNEMIPADLVKKIKDSQKFQAGWMSLRQLQFGMMDMSWYTTDPKQITDIDAFETAAVAETRLLPKIPGTNNSCSFSHIFAGGYSAGYYSYKWAEVLDADAFEYFKEKGIFNSEVATKFKENVLSKGDTDHPMNLYKKFRGHEPDPNALLRRDGLI